jgi:hypothetical protein
VNIFIENVFESLSLVDKIYVYIDKPETCLGKTTAKTNKYTGWVDEKKFCLFFHIINFEPSCQEETAKNIIRNNINFSANGGGGRPWLTSFENSTIYVVHYESRIS